MLQYIDVAIQFPDMSASEHFRPSQIVCVEYESSCLYAQLIQVATVRRSLWVRPLVLTTVDDNLPLADGLTNQLADGVDSPQMTVYDLREDSDLILPDSLFRAALDIELLPLLEKLATFTHHKQGDRSSQLPLRRFVSHLWKAYPSVFQALP